MLGFYRERIVKHLSNDSSLIKNEIIFLELKIILTLDIIKFIMNQKSLIFDQLISVFTAFGLK
jgi:hypothetical protein